MKSFVTLLLFGFLAWCLLSALRSRRNPPASGAAYRPKTTLTPTHQQGFGAFPHSFEDELDFTSELELVRQAISASKNIEFMYCKPSETIFKKRVVRPAQILEIDHEYDFDTTLCVRGYCYLRKDERTFAFKRMQELKIQFQ